MGRMGWYLLRQAASSIPIIIMITLFVFLLIHMAPGDPAMLLAPESATAEEIEQIRENMGLNLPLHVQYMGFLRRLVSGDFGESHFYGEPVAEQLRMSLPATFELALTAMLLALVVAIPVGIISAVRQNSALDYTAMSMALFGVSMPAFWFGILLIMLFSAELNWLPASGRIAFGVNLHRVTGFYVLDSLMQGNWTALGNVARHLLLPAITLASAPTAAWSRLVRSSMLEVLHSDFVRTARAKGLRERIVVWKHTFRNGLIPVITMMGVQIRTLLGGSIVVETVFGFPGMGRLLMTGISYRDYSLVLGVVTVFAIVAVLINLLVDIAYVLADPRVQYA